MAQATPMSPALQQTAAEILSNKDKKSQVGSEYKSIDNKSIASRLKEATTYSRTNDKVADAVENRSRHSNSVLPPDPRTHHNHDPYIQSQAGSGRNMHLVPCRW